MKLLLIRHGEAVDAGPDITDGHRWLTARGRAETAVAGAHLRKHPPRAIATSPLVRAVQTAELIAALAPPDGPITVLPSLATGHVASITRYIESAGAHGPLALVGHEPTLSELVVALLKPPRWAGFEKSGVVALARHGGVWAFEWMFLARTATTVDRLPG
jgi:phosphohistidine phosphatase